MIKEWDDEDDEQQEEVEDDAEDPDYAPAEDDWEEFSHFNMINDLWVVPAKTLINFYRAVSWDNYIFLYRFTLF